MYSQNKEEEVIVNYFGTRVGTFLDIGANDGKTFSNTRRLYELGWRGICIEPSPKAFERLKELYKGTKGVYCYPFAISNHNGKMILNESGPLCSPNDIGLVSTSYVEEMDRFRKTVEYTAVEVTCFRWKTALNRFKIKKFDFVSIDAEADDLMILRQMDLSEVKCICVEWNGKPQLKIEFEKLLEGFKLLYTSGENLVYGR